MQTILAAFAAVSVISATGKAANDAVLSQLELRVASGPVLGDLYPDRRVSFPDGVAGLPDLVYSVLSGYRPLALDLYLPPKADPTALYPVIIYVHGGGWTSGHSRDAGAIDHFPDFLASLARRGYVVASLNYRLDGEARFPAQIDDVRAAIRWLRANAARYRIDKTKFGIWGGSAGGHLAALAATSCGIDFDGVSGAEPANASESNCVQAAVGWYGVYDFSTFNAQREADRGEGSAADPNVPGGEMLGCVDSASACGEVMTRASPVTYASKNNPPILLIAGLKDSVVPNQQSVEFNHRLEAAGASSELILIPGVSHSFIGKTPRETRAASCR
jgi:acetyl esterase/lipase